MEGLPENSMERKMNMFVGRNLSRLLRFSIAG